MDAISSSEILQVFQHRRVIHT